MYKTNSVTFPPNGAQTPSLLTQPMDKSHPDLDCGGLMPIGSMLAINSPDQHLSHYHWTLQDGHHKLHNPMATMIQPSIHVKDWETPAILCNRQLFHCLTTQAPTDLGRPPPAHAHADDATWERWQQDNRQFPPWQYQPQFLTRPHEGEWQPITPLQRERLMALARQLHQDHRPTPIHSHTQHHVGQRLAFPISSLAINPLSDDSFQPSTPPPTYTVQLTETHGTVAILPNTLGTTAKTTHHQHMPTT